MNCEATISPHYFLIRLSCSTERTSSGHQYFARPQMLPRCRHQLCSAMRCERRHCYTVCWVVANMHHILVIQHKYHGTARFCLLLSILLTLLQAGRPCCYSPTSGAKRTKLGVLHCPELLHFCSATYATSSQRHSFRVYVCSREPHWRTSIARLIQHKERAPAKWQKQMMSLHCSLRHAR